MKIIAFCLCVLRDIVIQPLFFLFIHVFVFSFIQEYLLIYMNAFL